LEGDYGLIAQDDGGALFNLDALHPLSRYEAFLFFRSRLLDNNRFVVTFAEEEPVSLLFRSRRGKLFLNRRTRWSLIFPRLDLLSGGLVGFFLFLSWSPRG
jgi:hypothetical protein